MQLASVARVHQQIPHAILRRIEEIRRFQLHSWVNSLRERLPSVDRRQTLCALEARLGCRAPGRARSRRLAQTRRQLLEARQIVHGQKVIDVAERRHHAARQRLVVGRPEERVEPDRAAGSFVARAQSRGPAAPDRRGPSRRTRSAPPGRCCITRRAQWRLNARSASPMRVPPPQSCTDLRDLPDRAGGAAFGDEPGDARQTGRKQEAFDAPRSARQPPDEVQQHAAVPLHRSAHVREHDDRTRLLRRCARRGRSTSSPPCFMLRPTMRRRSTAPDDPADQRRVRRTPSSHPSCASTASAAVISAGVKSAKSFVRLTCAGLYAPTRQPRRAGRCDAAASSSSVTGTAGSLRRDDARTFAEREERQAAGGPLCARQNRSKASSKRARSS